MIIAASTLRILALRNNYRTTLRPTKDHPTSSKHFHPPIHVAASLARIKLPCKPPANVKSREQTFDAVTYGESIHPARTSRHRTIFCFPSGPNRNYISPRTHSLGNPHHIAIQPLLRQQRTRESLCLPWRALFTKIIKPCPGLNPRWNSGDMGSRALIKFERARRG